MVQEMCPGAAYGQANDASPRELQVDGSSRLFSAQDALHGDELWEMRLDWT